MLQLGHKQWELYKQSVQLANEVYRITQGFPDGERAVLVYTLRRLSVLLCQCIATGAVKCGKKRRKFFEVCLEHCIAIDTQLEIAITVALITPEEAQEAAVLLRFIYKNAAVIAQKS